MTRSQLRMYTVVDGRLEDFVREWREHVVPLRRAHGFVVEGAWTVPERDGFVWIISHDGDFEAADAAYYASPERRALDPDPASLLGDTETRMMVPVGVPPG